MLLWKRRRKKTAAPYQGRPPKRRPEAKTLRRRVAGDFFFSSLRRRLEMNQRSTGGSRQTAVPTQKRGRAVRRRSDSRLPPKRNLRQAPSFCRLAPCLFCWKQDAQVLTPKRSGQSPLERSSSPRNVGCRVRTPKINFLPVFTETRHSTKGASTLQGFRERSLRRRRLPTDGRRATRLRRADEGAAFKRHATGFTRKLKCNQRHKRREHAKQIQESLHRLSPDTRSRRDLPPAVASFPWRRKHCFRPGCEIPQKQTNGLAGLATARGGETLRHVAQKVSAERAVGAAQSRTAVWKASPPKQFYFLRLKNLIMEVPVSRQEAQLVESPSRPRAGRGGRGSRAAWI